MKLTEPQLDVLTHLARGQQHSRMRANHTLRQIGLTEWVWKCSDGVERGDAIVKAAWDKGHRKYDLVKVVRERITPRGRRTLAKHKATNGDRHDEG